MTSIGYTLMTEQSGPKELVTWAIGAERAGFDFEVMSDHYFPWADEQGHAPYAWTVLGAVAQVTSRVDLMTYVTCPMFRYHPAVVAQKAATLQIVSDGRFTLGLGSGENLNEHVTGDGWPPVSVRHEMLDEAIQVIRSRAHEQFRWFAGGWKVNAELPGTSGFSGATQFVRAEDVAEAIPCGPDVEPIVESFSAFWDAGYTDVSLVQIGGDAQAEFLEFAETDLLPALREAAPTV
jgi:alkanesulfonate monooxygenase SsuD/methylene tetrahydromethanopterin reductase-like flavin-dependent oxidoreductase (luciferase family)